MRAGDTFVISFDHVGPTPHLWILAAGPDAEGRIVLVSITTLRRGKDQTVVLQSGDHPFVEHPSCVFYQDAMIADASRLEDWIAGDLAKPFEPCSAELLKLVRDGFNASEFTPKKVMRLIQGH
jgi:hypothetical protein